MRSLEEKIAAAKKENIILFTCIGVVVEFFAGQVYRSIRDIQLNNGELNVDSILNNMICEHYFMEIEKTCRFS